MGTLIITVENWTIIEEVGVVLMQENYPFSKDGRKFTIQNLSNTGKIRLEEILEQKYDKGDISYAYVSDR